MKINKKLIILGAIAVAVVAAVVVAAVVLIGGGDNKKKEENQPQGGYKDCVINFAKSVEEADGELMEKAYSPIVERNDAIDFEVAMKELAIMQHHYFKDEYGKNFKIEISFEGEEQLGEEEIGNLTERIRERGYDGEISEGLAATTIFKISSDEGERTVYAFFEIVKYNGEWGIIGGDFDE